MKESFLFFSQACEENHPTFSYLNQNYVLTLLTVSGLKGYIHQSVAKYPEKRCIHPSVLLGTQWGLNKYLKLLQCVLC